MGTTLAGSRCSSSGPVYEYRGTKWVCLLNETAEPLCLTLLVVVPTRRMLAVFE